SEAELQRALVNIKSDLQYRSLVSLLLFESGDSIKAERIKNEIFAVDSIMLPFRNNLARHYLKVSNLENSIKELKFVYEHDPQNIVAVTNAINYYLRINDKEKAIWCCE